MVRAVLVVAGLALGVSATFLEKCVKLSGKNEQERKEIFTKYSLPPTALNISPRHGIGMHKEYHIAQDLKDVTFFTLRYNTANEITADQLDFHVEVHSKLHNEPFFAYDLHCFSSEDGKYLVFRQLRNMEHHFDLSLDEFTFEEINASYVQMLDIFVAFEHAGAAFTVFDSLMFVYASKRSLKVNPKTLAHMYRAGGKCYALAQTWLARKNLTQMKSTLVKNDVGFSYGVAEADIATSQNTYLELIRYYTSKVMNLDFTDDQIDLLMAFEQKVAQLAAAMDKTQPLGYDWESLRSFVQSWGTGKQPLERAKPNVRSMTVSLPLEDLPSLDTTKIRKIMASKWNAAQSPRADGHSPLRQIKRLMEDHPLSISPTRRSSSKKRPRSKCRSPKRANSLVSVK